MTRFSFTCLIAALTFGSLQADTIVFNNRADFLDAVSPVQTESFEAPFDDSPSVSFTGFTATEVSDFPLLKSRTDYVSAGERALGFTWNGSDAFVLEFSPPIDALAVDILDFGTCCDAHELRATSDTGSVELIAATGDDRPRGNLQFFGFMTTEPIAKLTFQSETLSTNDLVVFDELAIRAVPEPSFDCLLQIGLAMLLIRGAKRRSGS